MAQQIINVGAAPNDGQGDPIRTAYIKCNNNFDQLYSRAQTTPPPSLVGSLGDEAGMYAYDSTYFYYCFADYDGSSTIWGQVTQVGNVSATQLLFGTTTVEIPAANANVVFSVNNTANVAVISDVGANISGFVTATGNLAGANLQISGLVTATGNVIGGNVISLSAISAVGNVSGNYFLGNGSLLSGLPETYANANVAAYLPTYTGNLVSLAGPVTTTANITGANLVTGGAITATGNVTGGNVNTAGNVTGDNLQATGNVTGGNVLTTGAVSATGNIFGAFFTGNGAGLTGVIATGNVGAASQLANGTSVLNIPTADGNIIGNISGTANVFVMANTGLYVNALISASGNITGGNLIATGLVSASGNVSAQNLNASQRVSAVGNIVTSGSFVASGDLSVNGNAQATNYQGSTISMIGNIVGANLQTAGTVTAASISASGNVTGGNIRTAGVVTATGNIDGANLTTGGRVLATGNVTGGNLTTGGIVTAVGNVIGQNFLTLGIISAAGNISGANIITAGSVNGKNFKGDGSNVASLENLTSQILVYPNSSITIAPQSYVGANFALTQTSFFTSVSIIGYSGSNANVLITGLVSATGNVTGNYFIGNGSQLTGVQATGVGTLSNLSVTGNTVTGNLSTAGVVTATGNITGGNIVTAGLISATGAITGAAITGTGLTVSTGNISCGNLVNNNANGVGNIGSSTNYFNTVFAMATSAQYADLAEKYTADAEYEPGTVVMFGGSAEVTKCDSDTCTAVVGVVSTNPAYLMNAELSGDHVVAVALMGRVPCKVRGPVARGSLMVSAGNGLARAEVAPAPGTIIGKAIESFDGDAGTIEILVGRV